MKRSDPVVVVERCFECSKEALWQAISDPSRMRQWFFPDIVDFRPEPGFTTEFMVDAGERQFMHQWEVTDVEHGRVLAYRWRYLGYEGAARSVFELDGDESSCALRISFPVDEDFEAEIPEFEREACMGGWTYFIGALGDYLAEAG